VRLAGTVQSGTNDGPMVIDDSWRAWSWDDDRLHALVNRRELTANTDVITRRVTFYVFSTNRHERPF